MLKQIIILIHNHYSTITAFSSATGFWGFGVVVVVVVVVGGGVVYCWYCES